MLTFFVLFFSYLISLFCWMIPTVSRKTFFLCEGNRFHLSCVGLSLRRSSNPLPQDPRIYPSPSNPCDHLLQYLTWLSFIDCLSFFQTGLIATFLSLDVDGRVLDLSSFSKIVAPGCRCGWLVGPAPLVQKMALRNEVTVRIPSSFVWCGLNDKLG